ncbi:MAG: methylenetetrahydrofolate--tRNA-(uracil(54)-C(5))-methyltransferase (FADH(2)-oxidizing) TrmFO [Bdellovibrionales bacterium]|nr:methylenetetrahydrofolate--tRNA-(uracil(54)-C(5))-methyltransferase (FADH(2)-oxidizing) TrmFO [Bdellovibrionales bacterium]
MTSRVTVIGGGLAGCEATYQLVTRGIEVTLYEMRPSRSTRAHKTGNLAELVCSNSFRGASLSNAVGLLKAELVQCGSLIMKAALQAAVPAGGALAVDRTLFSEIVDSTIREHPLCRVVEEEVCSVPQSSEEMPVIIATGPLTSPHLAHPLEELVGQQSLAFYDAISPIVLGESLDFEKVYRKSRYGKGAGDEYLNIPLSESQYYEFVNGVAAAEKFSGHEDVESEVQLRPFEGCMPIEDMIERGLETLRFGPFKPVGLEHPETGERPYAVCQLRQDDKAGTLWSLVGMQTRMKHPEQLRLFRTLPGLEGAEFVRLGSVHRNTFLNSPACLSPTLEFRAREGLFFAGQITGTEGYVESTAGGLVAGLGAYALCQGQAPRAFPQETAIGSLMGYISDPERRDFQPMNISFGLMKSYTLGSFPRRTKKPERRKATSRRALEALSQFGFHAPLPEGLLPIEQNGHDNPLN